MRAVPLPKLAKSETLMSLVHKTASNDDPGAIAWSRNQKILEWLNRLTQPALAFDTLGETFDRQDKVPVGPGGPLMSDDWLAVASICGHDVRDFIAAGASLPLTMAEVEHFRRNHRNTENHVNRDFLTARTDLPSPLAELYGLYMHRARIDAEAVLFMAQATGSTRVARIMADLLAIGSFANGLEYIHYLGLTYSVPAAFDTSDIIDCVNHEAARRLALPGSHPAHLLKLTPDELSMLAANMAEKNVLKAADFLEKSNLLSEARQDVTRLPTSQQFATSIIERDLPLDQAWVTRICAAYARIFENWVASVPEVVAGIQ
jgi:hypothetical protein